jgi:MYXO-CTERM domain-containing protein
VSHFTEERSLERIALQHPMLRLRARTPSRFLVLCSGFLLAACGGDSRDPAAPAEAVFASPAPIEAVAAPEIASSISIPTPEVFGGPASPMVALRSRHTASLLTNGQVLAVGGTDGTTDLASAELFDPVLGAWTSTGAMAQAREQHSAVVLGNGKVLVAGGLHAGGALGSVEIYDPQASMWAPGAPMTLPRAHHTMTRLANGSVLVVGGTDGGVSLAGCEIYDPLANTWTAVAPLHQARARHTTALLADGRVVVVGGNDDLGTPVATVEILSAAKGTWSFGAPLATARTRHTTTLLADGSLLVAGGVGTTGFLASVERYAPSTNLWAAAGVMVDARADHTALLAPLGHVIVAGGQGSSGALATAEAYEPVQQPADFHAKYIPNPWFSAGSMTTARAEHTVTLLANGTSFHAGGASLPSSELFNDSPGALGTTCSSPAQCGSGFCANGVCCSSACSDECVGADATGACVNLTSSACSTFDSCNVAPTGYCQNGSCSISATGHYGCLAFPDCGAMSCSGLGFGCAASARPNGFAPTTAFSCQMPACDCAGGYSVPSGYVDPLGHPCTLAAQCGADLCTNGFCVPACAGPTCWVPDGHFTNARLEHTATLLPDGKVLFAGGQDLVTPGYPATYLSVFKSGDVYDPLANTWTTSTMAASHFGHTATLLPGGQVLVLGGATSATHAGAYVQIPGAIAELYTPAGNTWAPSGPLLAGRKYHTATLLPGGQILVLGGLGKSASFVDTALSAAELYAPTTGTSAIVAPMPRSRDHHTATLLANGRVLVIGGSSSAQVDIYDPATDTWFQAAPLPAPRSRHTATTLSNGHVLVTGGDLGQPGSSAVVYDPTADTWTPAASMAAARAGHAATLVNNGDVIVAGGGVGAERYDPLADTWASYGAMLAPSRRESTLTLLANGRLLVGFGLRSKDLVWGTVNVELTAPLPPPLGQPCSTSASCNGASCVDGVCCDTACNGGSCDACTVALGATADGTCTALDGAACDDGNACTTGDACQGAVCAGSAPVCPVPDLCHSPGVCVAQTGQCTPSVAIDCGLADACHAATCNLATGACDGLVDKLPDGSPCVGGTCEDGVCTPTGSAASASSSAGVGGGGSASSSASTSGNSSASASSSAGVGGGSASSSSAASSSAASSSASTTGASSSVAASSSAGVGGGSASSTAASTSSAASTTAGVGGSEASSTASATAAGTGGASSSITAGAGGAPASSSGSGGAPSTAITAASAGVGGSGVVASGGCAVQPERAPTSIGAWLGLAFAALAARRRERRNQTID